MELFFYHEKLKMMSHFRTLCFSQKASKCFENIKAKIVAALILDVNECTWLIKKHI